MIEVGQDRAARRPGRRNHAWKNDCPGRAVCKKCGYVRTFVKRGNKWVAYYQKPGQPKRRLKNRRVPGCVPPASP